MAAGPYPLRALLLIFAVKFLFTALCYGSGSPGGIFLPLLACGALLGAAFGASLAALGFAESGEGLNFAILGMAAFFVAVVQAPLTGAVLILEMCGNFNHLAGLVLACMAAFVTTEALRSRPVYDTLLDRILSEQGPKRQPDVCDKSS